MSPGVGTGYAGECRQEANFEDFQEIYTKQVTPLVNLDDGLIVSTGQVNEHTNVASRHPVDNIILYKRKKKFRAAYPPHSDVHEQNEQGSSPKIFGESGVGKAIIEDVYPLLSYSPQSLTFPGYLDHGVFVVRDKTSKNVDPLLSDPLQISILPSQQGESLIGEERIEVHDLLPSDPIEATRNSWQLQSFVGDERERDGDLVTHRLNDVLVDGEMPSEQGESPIGDKMREEYDPLMSDPLQTPSFPSKQGEYVVEEERIGVLDSVALDSIEATTNVLVIEHVSLKHQTPIRDGGREECDSVAL
ncbi:hypothetical protein K7X08_011972 [Anisodus acutangulus]|uniref:Uncharacterized protein n=1 Tax=Anisodus acutangulus TaxID=402998 RepID=A0A9Q1LCM3_9SOLA|nr:hypothetical protein K7X08_011972 [Anisodus acutangulus]